MQKRTNGYFRLIFAAVLSIFLLLPSAAYAAESWSVGETNITSTDVSPDGKRIAVGTYAAEAAVFDSEGNKLYTAQANNVVTGVAFLPDGRLAVSSDDRKVYLYDAEGNQLWASNLKKLLKGIAVSGDGSVIAVISSGSSTVKLLDEEGTIAQEYDIGILPLAVAVSDNGEWIAAAGSDQYIYVLSKDGEQQRKLGVNGTIQSVAVTDEGLVTAGTTSSEVYLFPGDSDTPKVFRTADAATDVDVTLDGRYVAAADFVGNYYVLTSDGSLAWKAKGNGAGRSVSFSPDATVLYTASGNGTVQRFDIESVIAAAQQRAKITTIAWSAGAVLGAALLAAALFIMKRRGKLGYFKAIWRARFNYLMIVPSFALIFLFLYYPAFSGLLHSFYDWNPGARSTFIGLDNYVRMFQDPYVAKGTGNLLLLILASVFKAIVPPLLVAELIYFLRNKKSQYWFRTAFVTSMIIPGVAGLLIWQNLYDPNVGLINKTLTAIGLGTLSHPWLADPKTAMAAIIFMGFPFIGILPLLVYYAGLISIPNELVESAKIDGAATGRIIRSIHLPLLAGQMKLLIILSFIGSIQDFSSILIVTGGGPLDSTYVPALQMYYAATNFNNLGYASALGVTMFVIILAITIVNMKFIRTQTD